MTDPEKIQLPSLDFYTLKQAAAELNHFFGRTDIDESYLIHLGSAGKIKLCILPFNRQLVALPFSPPDREIAMYRYYKARILVDKMIFHALYIPHHTELLPLTAADHVEIKFFRDLFIYDPFKEFGKVAGYCGKNSIEPKDAGNMDYVIKAWSAAGYVSIYAPVACHLVSTYQLWLKDHSVTVLGLALPIDEHMQSPALKSELAELVKAKPIDTDSFCYGGGTFRLVTNGIDNGVYFIGKDKEGEDVKPLWLCSTLRVIAITSDSKSSSWGRLLEWTDRANVTHKWAMPMELLAGDGGDIRRELYRQGVLMNNGKFARDRFTEYLQMSPTHKQSLCVDRIGWHGAVFVLPDRTAGNSDQLTVFQNPSGLEPAFSQAGTLQDWITHIGQPAQGNSRLVFALSLAFTGALLELANEESGGFHLRGSSSIGKSTALLVASSVWGNPSKYRRQWRTTTNGLEGLRARTHARERNIFLAERTIDTLDPPLCGFVV